MRKFLSSTAGATFNQETPNITVNVRKDCLELICKVNRGMYVVLNMVHNHLGGITLVANWGRYFNRLQNPQVQMPKIDKNCPTLAAVMHNEDPDKVYEIELDKKQTGEEKVHGFAVNIDYDKEEPLISCVNKDVLHAAYLLVNKNVKMYNELFKNPPFPAWKDGLNEVWN